jgi:hypothetical protein
VWRSLRVMGPVAVGVFSTLMCIHEGVVGHITVVGTIAVSFTLTARKVEV